MTVIYRISDATIAIVVGGLSALAFAGVAIGIDAGVFLLGLPPWLRAVVVLLAAVLAMLFAGATLIAWMADQVQQDVARRACDRVGRCDWCGQFVAQRDLRPWLNDDVCARCMETAVSPMAAVSGKDVA